jgi:hypothetical protein
MWEISWFAVMVVVSPVWTSRAWSVVVCECSSNEYVLVVKRTIVPDGFGAPVDLRGEPSNACGVK